MVIGEYIKRKRLELKLSRKNFSKGVISSDHLANIENNKNELRANTFISLMNNNKISLNNFLENFDPIYTHGHVLQIKASEALFNHDVATLKNMIKTFPYPNSVAVQVIKLMLYKAKKEPEALSQKSKKIIKKFLLEVETWDENSLWVIANSLDIYSLKEIKGIINWILDSEKNFIKYTDYQIKLLAQICVNYLQLYCKDDQAQKQVQKVYEYLAQLPNRSVIFYEKAYAKSIQKECNENNFFNVLNLQFS